MDKYVSGFADGNVVYCPFCGGDNVFQRCSNNLVHCCDCKKEFYVITEDSEEDEKLE